MSSFAHIADAHVGVTFRDPQLRELNLRAFELAIDKCIEKKVDFVVIAGDLFHVNIPDMASVDRAVKKLTRLKERDIPVYLIYGSHDYSPVESSMIDILASASLFTKVSKARQLDNGSIVIDFTVDSKTGAKLCGLSARKQSLEKKYYELLDRMNLEQEQGFKIFMYHAALTEFKPEHLSSMASIPYSLFPKNFQYYAGGHVHRRFEKNIDEYGLFAEPGALFGTSYTDLENNEQRGFFIVHFENNTITNHEFVPVTVAETQTIRVNVNGLTAQDAEEKIMNEAKNAQCEGKIVLLKIKGELKAGKPSDINFEEVKKQFSSAKMVYMNKSKLTVTKTDVVRIKADSIQEIEQKVFKEQLKNQDKISSSTAQKILDLLRKENITLTKQQYEESIIQNVTRELRLEE